MSSYSREVPHELGKFVKDVEVATNTHDFDNVAPFIHPQAVYWFSGGREFKGIDQIRDAFVRTWKEIPNEQYGISAVRWPLVTDASAVYHYLFKYLGYKADGQRISGKGRGTNVLTREEDCWLIVHEHLSR